MNKKAVTIPLKCKCGQFHGAVDLLKPNERSRYACHCDDCQAYMHFLGRDKDGLDKHGGTEIVATLPSRVRIDSGKEHLRVLRLTENGTYRWFLDCCNTALCNVADPRMPYVGIVHTAIAWTKSERNEQLGPPMVHANGQWATNPPLPKYIVKGMPKRILAHIFLRLGQWWLKGAGTTELFFKDYLPTVRPYLLTKSERDALRPFIGPAPTKAKSKKPTFRPALA